MIELAREIAAKLGMQSISRSHFVREAGVSQHHIHRLFDSFNDLCRRVGFEPNITNVRLSDDAIFEAMRKAFVSVGGVVPKIRFQKVFEYDTTVFRKRGWNWDAAKVRFREWLDTNDVDFPYRGQLDNPISASAPPSSGENPATSALAWGRIGVGPQYGDFINFRGLQHAPINEQGVEGASQSSRVDTKFSSFAPFRLSLAPPS